MSKRKNEELSEESKRQMEEIQPHEVEQTSKPQFFRLDELVHNSGLKHIALQIFSELDPKSHVNCRMVSKGWKDCIDNDKCLMQKQLYQYKCQLGERQKKFSKDFNVARKAASLKDFDEAIEHVYKKESLTNLKVFTMFMKDYFNIKQPVRYAYNYLGERTEITHSNHQIMTPLMFAAKQNRLDVLQMCADSPLKIMDMNVLDEPSSTTYGTILGEMCKRNQAEVIEFYMNLKGSRRVDFNKRGRMGYTLFGEACKSNHVQVVKLFLDRAEELDIELNFRTQRGMTPIMYPRSKDVMQLLLNDERIDATATDNDGYNVLHHICQALVDDGNRMFIPALAVEPEKEDQVGDTTILLLQSSKVPYIKDIRGMTPLHHVCDNHTQNGQRMVAVLDFIMKKESIDVNEEDNAGRTAAHIVFKSAFNSEPKLEDLTRNKVLPSKLSIILKYAKKMGINLEATDNNGKTPLHHLCGPNLTPSLRRSSIAKAYIESFLDVAKTQYGIEFNLNATDNSGKTPMETLSEMWKWK